jgi:hypothetical protein
MEAARKIYVFSKDRLLLEQKVDSFISKMKEVQKLTQEASLTTLIEQSKRLLRELQVWDCRWLTGSASLEKVIEECALLSRVEKIYESHASKYNEILQLLISETSE